MKRLALTSLAAALLLTACVNKQNPENSDAQPSTRASKVEKAPSRAAKSAAVDNACRPAGEGHTIGRAKNDIYMCSASAALNSAKAKEVLDPSIRIRYGSAGRGDLTSRQTSSAVGRTADETCQQAFLSTAIQFQKAAATRGRKSATMTSYYDRKTVGGNTYECHIATFHSKVVMRGSVH